MGNLGNIGPRQLKRFMRSPSFAASVPPGQVQQMEERVRTTKSTSGEDVVHEAGLRGEGPKESVAKSAGLTDRQVGYALSMLVKGRHTQSSMVDLSGLSGEERATYQAVEDGVDVVGDLPGQTGLSSSQVKQAVLGLRSRGLLRSSNDSGLRGVGSSSLGMNTRLYSVPKISLL